MSAFTQSWLEQREPLDRAARNTHVLDACADCFSGREALAVCDLGAGTGSSLRAFAARLPPRQQWTLVDHDENHLAAACTSLRRWASGSVEDSPDGFRLSHDSIDIAVRTLACDLSKSCDAAIGNAGLVTASALFDLVSDDWLGRFVSGLAARRIPLYAALTFDGEIRFSPAHPRDGIMIDAFLAHQRGDKGFGPAAGAGAHAALIRHLKAAGYTMVDGASPWRLDTATPGVMDAFLDGMAEAAREVGRLDPRDATAWREDRRMQTIAITVGHRDLFAAPPPG